MSRGSFQRLLSFNPVPRGKSFTGLSVKAPSLCLQGHCGGLKENGPKGSGTIRRRGLVGVGVFVLEGCVTVGAGFEVFFAQASLSVTLRSLPAAFKM